MERKDDGGEAFPLPYFAQGFDLIGGHPGMSLRDWFAGQALAVIDPSKVKDYELSAMFGPNRSGIAAEEIAAALAYRVADAMLARRSK